MDTAYVRENPPPKIAVNKVQDTSILGTWKPRWSLFRAPVPSSLSSEY